MAARTEVHTFRIPFWRMYLPAVMYAQALYAPLMWLVFFLQDGVVDRRHIVLYLAGATGVSVLLVPAFLVYVWVYPVRVSAAGFTCSNGVGRMVTVPWGAITGVRRLVLPGFPYLLVTTSQTRLKLWLPLFLGRFEEFVDKVEEYAGSDHVLYRHLWRQAAD